VFCHDVLAGLELAVFEIHTISAVLDLRTEEKVREEPLVLPAHVVHLHIDLLGCATDPSTSSMDGKKDPIQSSLRMNLINYSLPIPQTQRLSASCLVPTVELHSG
jgi:hypothetical protein